MTTVTKVHVPSLSRHDDRTTLDFATMTTKKQNPSCDGSHFMHEIDNRIARNRELSPDNRFDLPKWSTLKVYEGQ